jgi:hypothetical protein
MNDLGLQFARLCLVRSIAWEADETAPEALAEDIKYCVSPLPRNVSIMRVSHQLLATDCISTALVIKERAHYGSVLAKANNLEDSRY